LDSAHAVSGRYVLMFDGVDADWFDHELTAMESEKAIIRSAQVEVDMQ
jgi:delta-aminolevulinic acid dehydratase/porphobilinogen synthase